MAGEWKKFAGLELYQLFVDGQPSTVTALVDRQLSRADQIARLADLTEVPAQVLALAQTDVIEQGMAGRPTFSLPEGRLQPPVGLKLDVLRSADDPSVEPPVWRYLWPGLAPDGSVRLED